MSPGAEKKVRTGREGESEKRTILIHLYQDPPRGAKWMGKGAIKQLVRD